jgi:hypothetical protein
MVKSGDELISIKETRHMNKGYKSIVTRVDKFNIYFEVGRKYYSPKNKTFKYFNIFRYYPNSSLYKKLYPMHEVIGNKIKVQIFEEKGVNYE